MAVGNQIRERSAGFTMIELMIAVVIVSLVSAMAVPVYDDALNRARRSALLADSGNLYRALLTYQFDYDKFPSEAEFDLETLDPLRSGGYFSGAQTFANKLEGGQVLIYVAPDVGGADTQFILVTRAAFDRNYIVAVVHTDVIDETGGWVDGVYVIDGDDLEEAEADEDVVPAEEPAAS